MKGKWRKGAKQLVALAMAVVMLIAAVGSYPVMAAPEVLEDEPQAAVPEGTGQVLYSTDFSTYDDWDTYKGWDPVTWTPGENSWTVSGGRGPKAVLKDQSFTDFVMEADITVDAQTPVNNDTSSAQGGLVFRVTNPYTDHGDGYSGYYVCIDAYKREVALGKVTNGTQWTAIANKKADIEYGVSYHVTITVAGNHIVCYVNYDGVQYAKIDVTDDSHSAGSVGVRTWLSQTTYRNLKVSEYTEPQISGETYQNPILPNCADPDVLYDNGTYYLYPTNAGNSDEGIKVYTSTDLVNWTDKGWALSKNDVWGDKGFWAPDIIERDGTYYMYYTANEHIAVATSKSPLGPFTQTEKKPMHENTNEIDAHAFQDDDGQYYFYFVRFDNGNLIYGAKLNDDMESIDESTVTLLLGRPEGWETDRGNINEGPFMLKKDGKYYLTYSGAHFESPMYGCGYAVSDNPLSGFEKYRNNPIMQSNILVKGAGHHCVTTSPDGQELFMVYHCHNNTTTTEPRRLCIDRLQFVEKDGETVLEVKGPTTTAQSIPSGAGDVDNLISAGSLDVKKITVEAGSTPDDWNLPMQVTNMVTSKSDPQSPYSAEIAWDTSAYDVKDTSEREIELTGMIVLPENVENLGNLDLSVKLKVSVKGELSTESLSGLYAQYYTTAGSGKNVRLDTLKSEGIDTQIRFTDLDSKLSATTGQSDYAGIRWTGQIEVPETGDYTFYSDSDNGFRMWIEDEQLINYWDAASWDAPQTSKKVSMEAGKKYKFVAEFFDDMGGSHATLSWSNGSSIPQKTAIPESAFYMPADYEGIYISKIEASEENLMEGKDFTVTLSGMNLSSVKNFEVVKATGESLAKPVMAVVSKQTDKTVTLSIPGLNVGTYKLQATSGLMKINSSQNLVVRPNTENEATRTETPRRDWVRDSYVNLNGWWDFDFDPNGEGLKADWYAKDHSFAQNINVPFCWESSLSGIQNEDYKGEAWYQRTVSVDSSWKDKKIFLKFGAVDWKCHLWVNGEDVGEHIGGYSAFEMDVTDYMKVGQENVITLWVEDFGNYGDNNYPALVGKQGKNAPCGYTHTSGIWQTVGMEARSNTYLDNAKAASDIDNSQVNYTLELTSDEEQMLTVEYDFESTLYDADADKDVKTGSKVKGSQKIQVKKGANTIALDAIKIENQKLWSYNEANLYQGTLTVKDSKGATLDKLDTYFGLRKIETKYYNEDLGVRYIYLNNEPIYLSGLLDQGFWEEGIYTAPSEEALKYDILAMKEAGFNMIRKHLKIEDPLQYYWCDKLGMMVWQDMPHATAMVPTKEGGPALGRKYYEECLDTAMEMNYNHPAIVAVMLFNETWGLQTAYFDGFRDRKADDGLSTGDWVEKLWNETKEKNPNVLVEDMSPCNRDHVQPTDLNTYHMYPSSYAGTVNDVEYYVNGAYPGSTNNFKFGETQDGDPLLNSEYGGVAAYAGDYDVSYCFKYMTDIQRRYEKQSGFVYTEPYDVEYERNGILTYDRQKKVFGYDEIAYGGDMGIKDLTQEVYIGVVDTPIKNVKPGQKIKTEVMAMAWTNDVPENTVAKWRFDGTDLYGNNISTGLGGNLGMEILPYEKSEASLSFRAPDKACVGTLTVWLESKEGEKIAKNFINIVVANDSSANKDDVWETGDNTVVMKAKVDNGKMVTTEGIGEQTYTYTIPEDFDISKLDGMRVLAEASSYKGQMGTDKNRSSFSSQYGQTAEGRERASDLTVLVNGVEISTVLLPDNPRDMRGTLSLNQPYNGATSAGDFGYLVNLNINAAQLKAIKDTLDESNTLEVTYKVKEDAENANGLRIYNSVYGRYAVNPTVILNPQEIETAAEVADAKTIKVDGNNYSAEAVLTEGSGFQLRDGGYQLVLEGGKAVLSNKSGEVLAQTETLSGNEHYVKATLFDDHIQVYVDENPEAAIDVYDYSGFTGGITCIASSDAKMYSLAVSPETYKTNEEPPIEEEVKDVLYEDDFSDADYESRYTVMRNDSWSANVTGEALKLSAGSGDKIIFKEVSSLADGVIEADVSVYNLKDSGGNAGFVFRASNFTPSTDGADGYYAGIGNGYVQVGRMNQGWTELAKVNVSGLTLGSTHRLRVAAFGSRIQVYLDDSKAPVVDLTDTTYTEGGVAIRGFRTEATFDNVKVSSEPYYTTSFEKGKGEWDANGTWTVKNGDYTSKSEGTCALIDSRDVKDVFYEATLKFEDTDSATALLVHAKESDASSYGYQVIANAKDEKIQIVKASGADTTVLAEIPWIFTADESFRLAAEIIGNTIKVYVDGSEKAVLMAEDASYPAGKIGILNVQGKTIVQQVKVNTQFIDGDVLVSADKTLLNNLIKDAVSDDNKDNYTEESWAEYQKALEAAKEIAAKENATQAEVNAACKALTDAQEALEEKKPDTTTEREALQAAIDHAEADFNQDDYTAESWAELQSAIADAKEALTKEDATADELTAAKAAIEKAIKALVEKTEIQTAALIEAIAAAEALKEADYTAESWAVLQSLLNDAKAILTREGVTQTEVDEAADSVNAAVEALVKADNTTPTPTPPVEAHKSHVGQTFIVNNLKYKVTKDDENGREVRVTSLKKKVSTLTIPKKVTNKEWKETFKVTSVKAKAFKGQNFKKVVIGANVTKIGPNAFLNCKKLTAVKLGKSVKTIGVRAFYGCSRLKKVTIKSTVLKTVKKNAFKKISPKAVIKVPKGKKKAYKNKLKGKIAKGVTIK